MNVMVFDTETTSLDKPFCYNVGYTIINTIDRIAIVSRDFIVEQVWHNLPLFSSVYYADKRPLYIAEMRKHKTIMDKWGHIMQQMKRDIKSYNVESAFAYNSPFDDKVFTFNCDWFKTQNPFDTLPIYDIRGYANQFITHETEFIEFCEEYSRFTDSGNYSATAETVFQYITANPEFIEAHTALNDSEIEAEILLYCLDKGAELNTEYEVKRILPRRKAKPFTVKIDGQPIYQGEYFSKYARNDTYNFKTK